MNTPTCAKPGIVGATAQEIVGATRWVAQGNKGRHSIRLKCFDYRWAAAYFVTLCAQERRCLFGEIQNGVMGMNESGCIVAEEWQKTASIRGNVEVDQFVVMPNHFHGILIIVNPVVAAMYPTAPGIVGATRRVAHGESTPTPAAGEPARLYDGTAGEPAARPYGIAAGSLGAIIGQVKSAVSKRIGRPVWQRNYFEHVVRDDNDLNRIREYIATNPIRWTVDRENLQRTGEDEFDRWLASFSRSRASQRLAPTERRATPRVAPTDT
jgi:REP element-mobilizing transposase RayT